MLALAAAEVSVRAWIAPDMHWFQPVFRADPQVGYTLRPGDHGVVLGAPLRANTYGYRGNDWAPNKAEGTLRVAVIGDSHAFGYGVDEAAALPAVLERQLAAELGGRAVEVLGFALPGYSARQELSVFENKALPFSPDALVLVLCDNDDRDDLWVDADGWLRGDAPGSGDDARAHVQGPFLPSSRLRLLRYSRLLGWLKLQSLRARMRRTPPGPGWNLPVGPGPYPERLQREVYAPVRRVLALCRERGMPVVVALFASDPPYRRLLATIAAEQEVPTLDLLTLFPDADSWDDLVLRFGLGWDPHLGADAHARWGRALARLLATELARPR